ncbi:unnamed protein product, partial [Durusdinium trenchii]
MACWCSNSRGALGKGTRKTKTPDSWYKDLATYGIPMNLVKTALQTRLLTFLCPKEMYSSDPSVFKHIIDIVVDDWKQLEDSGIEIPAYGTVFPIVLGNKGDWSYLTSVLSPFTLLIVWISPMYPRIVAKRLIRAARTCGTPPPWDVEPAWTRLLHDESPGGAQRFHRPDVWHTVHMGIGKAWVASSVKYVQFLTGESSVDKRVAVLSDDYMSFCEENSKVKYLKKFEAHTFGLKAPEPAASWNKAHLTATLMQWLQSYLEKFKDACDADLRLRFIAASSVVLAHFGIWIERSKAQELIKAGEHFLQAYQFLAHKAIEDGKPAFAMFPKSHRFQELVEEMAYQIEVSPYCWNILADACFQEEDMVGRISALTRMVHDRQIQGLQRVNSPQKSPWFRRVLALCSDTEGLYPIHLAAKLGKPQLVKLLLQEGAEKETETSKGR